MPANAGVRRDEIYGESLRWEPSGSWSGRCSASSSRTAPLSKQSARSARHRPRPGRSRRRCSDVRGADRPTSRSRAGPGSFEGRPAEGRPRHACVATLVRTPVHYVLLLVRVPNKGGADGVDSRLRTPHPPPPSHGLMKSLTWDTGHRFSRITPLQPSPPRMSRSGYLILHARGGAVRTRAGQIQLLQRSLPPATDAFGLSRPERASTAPIALRLNKRTRLTLGYRDTYN